MSAEVRICTVPLGAVTRILTRMCDVFSLLWRKSLSHFRILGMGSGKPPGSMAVIDLFLGPTRWS
jgi:hypothetical protein